MLNDWPHHRERRRPSVPHGSNMIATPRPAELEYISVSAILFLADEDQPRIITVKCRPPHYPTRNLCPIPQLQPYFDAPPDSIVLTQGPSGELLRSPLHVFYSSTALTKGAPINHSIHRITSGAAAKPWYGNVVAFKFNGSRCQRYTDAGSSDLPALSAYFLSHQ
ncbi:hypothetical protein B0H13DRAFT_2029676 [Mycena leptocephala]|nr:hypothetical protein B0H13DRAFT_2029676 [Mycena leptocephala]